MFFLFISLNKTKLCPLGWNYMLYVQVEIKEYVNILGTQKNNNTVFKFFTIFFPQISVRRATGQNLTSQSAKKKTKQKSFRHFFENSEVVKEIALFSWDRSVSWTTEAEEEDCESTVHKVQKVYKFCWVMSSHTCHWKRILNFQ